MDACYAPLFEPHTLRRSGIQLRNRLLMAPMPTFGGDADGTPCLEDVAYFARRSGGVAALITPCCAITERGIAYPGHWRCDHPANSGGRSRVADAIHAGGALPVLQIGHAGPVWEGPEEGHRPEDLDADGFEEALERATAVARSCGFAAVELHGSHGEFVEQLLRHSSASAAAEALVRWVRRTAENYSCWMRVPAALARAGLLSQLAEAGAEVVEVDAKRFAAPENESSARAALARAERHADLAGVGGIATPEDALQVRSWGLPLAALGRALISEPDWVQKVQSGDSGLRVAREHMPRDPDERAVPRSLLARFRNKRRMA